MRRFLLSALLALAPTLALAQFNPFNPDFMWCATRGSVVVRGATSWGCLTPGTAGQVLQTNGPGADTSWLTVTGTGTVTSVAATVPSFLTISGSPITTSGTLAFALATQSANTIFAGPTGGAPAAPTFRAFVLSDLPTQANNTVLSNISGGVAVPAANTVTALLDTIGATRGNILFRDATVWNVLAPGAAGQSLVTGGAGADPSWADRVSSVAVSGGTTGLTTSGGPITTSGTITIAGTLVAANGGTGLNTFAVGDLLYASTTSALSRLAPGTAGQVLQTNASAAPTWRTIAVPQCTTYTSGSGTYSVPAGTLWLTVEMVGGGGGGAGSGTGSSGGTGSNGGDTTFGGVTAGGGVGSVTGGNGGVGGAVTGTLGTTIGFGGAQGGTVFYGYQNAGNFIYVGGPGGASFFGGAGASSGGTGIAALANTGSGGGGAGGSGVGALVVSGGGGAGAYARMIVTSPGAGYSYGVGAGGGGGAAGTSGAAGGAGAAGRIIVCAYFQ